MTRSTLPKAGHLPGHLRDAFLEAVERDDWAELYRLAGLVWNCTDTLPAGACEALSLPLGSSYGQAARLVRGSRRGGRGVPGVQRLRNEPERP